MSITVSNWARNAVRSRIEAAMLAQIQVLRGSLGVLDPATGLVGGLTSSSTIYSGKARIRTVSGGGTISVGGAEINVRSVVISIPITSALPHRDDLVKIVADDAADASMDTRIFRVMGVDAGSLFGDARRFQCEGWYSSRYWGPQ